MSVTKKYLFMQGLYWMLYCIAGSFLSLYLLDQGLNNKTIGVVTALFGAISAALEPVLGRICDRSRRFTWKKVLLALACFFLVTCILMLIIPNRLVRAALLGLLFLCINMMMPMMNGAISYYDQHGQHIDFGIARGTGSGLYAVISLLVGHLAALYGSDAVPAAGVALSVVFVLFVRQMPCDANRPEKATTNIARERGFLRRYPTFVLMTVAFILLSTSHQMLCTYLLQIIQSLGGGSDELGIAMAIRAVVEVPILFAGTRFLKHARPKTLMMAASIGYGIRSISHILAQSLTAICLAQLTQALGYAIFASASVYYVMDTLEKRDQITGQALMTCTMASGNVLGSLIGGCFLDASGIPKMLHVNFILAAGGIVLVFLSCFLSESAGKKATACFFTRKSFPSNPHGSPSNPKFYTGFPEFCTH